MAIRSWLAANLWRDHRQRSDMSQSWPFVIRVGQIAFLLGLSWFSKVQMNKVCRFRITVCKHFWAHLRLQQFVWVWAQQQFHYHPPHETKWGSNLWKASLQQHLLGDLVGLHHYLAAMPGPIQINIHQYPSQTSENTVSMRTSASVMMSTVVARSSLAPIRSGCTGRDEASASMSHDVSYVQNAWPVPSGRWPGVILHDLYL